MTHQLKRTTRKLDNRVLSRPSFPRTRNPGPFVRERLKSLDSRVRGYDEPRQREPTCHPRIPFSSFRSVLRCSSAT
ncbi:hypothetical protein [Lysobacter gummosus]|uniref:hypothetical protein n=1 Tax=Lysobacter gummosus TaxID=262324 RepID=UPI003643B9A5